VSGYKLAAKLGCKIVFVHFFTPKLFKKDYVEEEEQLHALKKHISANLASNELHEHIRLEFIAKEGDFKKDIVEFLKAHRASLIVMGSKGEHSIFDRIKMSNTRFLIQNTVMPVWVIPNGLPPVMPKVVIYATNNEDVTGIAFDHAIYLAEIFDVPLTILHITKPDTRRRFKGLMVQDLSIFRYKNVKKIKIDSRDPYNKLIEIIKDSPPALVALEKKERPFLDDLTTKSMYRELVNQGTVPLLVSS
jgi:nucleotide-binding universal stress UspA family protein